MVGAGDRAVAGLLSALAEAPDYTAAASYFLTQLAEIVQSSRGSMLRLDGAHDTLVLVTSIGFDATPSQIGIPISDLSSPLVISALTLCPSGISEMQRRAKR